jgi:hypothetical protein
VRFPAHHQELNDCSGSLWFYLRIVVTVVLLVLGPAAGRPAQARNEWQKARKEQLLSLLRENIAKAGLC